MPCHNTTMQTIHFAPGCVEHWHRRMLWEGHYVATNPKDHTGHADLIETHIIFFDFGSALKKMVPRWWGSPFGLDFSETRFTYYFHCCCVWTCMLWNDVLVSGDAGTMSTKWHPAIIANSVRWSAWSKRNVDFDSWQELGHQFVRTGTN